MKITTTIIRFLSGKSSCLQSGCNSEWFHRRPRFKCITDTEISPDTTQYVQLILLIYRIPFFFGINTGQISWFVQIKIRVRGLSQNLSGIRIHDHNRCILATGHSTSFFSGMFFIELLNVFFHNTLQGNINCCNNIIPILCCFYILFDCIIFIQITILSAICPRHNVIISTLNSNCSYISGISKTYHITCQCIIWVCSVIIILQPDSLYIWIILSIILYLIIFLSRLVIDSFFQYNISAIRFFFYNLSYRLFTDSETFIQYFNRRIYIFFFICHYNNIKNYIINPFTCRYLRTVSIQNISTFIWNCLTVINFLIQYKLCILASLRNINVCNSSYKNKKSQYNCHKQQYQLSLHSYREFFSQKLKSVLPSFSSCHLPLFLIFHILGLR